MRTLVAGLWLAVVWARPVAAQPDRAEPGPEAAAAYALLESDDEEARWRGCEVFIAQVGKGSMDPWSYRGAALCAALEERMREVVNSAFAAVPEGSAFGLFGRGFLAYLDEDLETAEDLLRQAVERQPRLALGWNALGLIVRLRGNVKAAIPLIEKALELAPDFEPARNNMALAQIADGVFDRLAALLNAIADRWQTPTQPRVPYSGKNPDEVLAVSTFGEAVSRSRFMITLALSPLETREHLIKAWLREHEPTEADVWGPSLMAQQQQSRTPREAALTLEAWLQLAEKLGRRDALLAAASRSIDLIALQRGAAAARPILRSWSRLAAPEEAALAVAQLDLSRAQILFRTDDNQGALDAYRKARDMFERAGNQLGQGNAWDGEADVLLFLGEHQLALSGYRKARTLFTSENSQLGQGNSWRGEAEVLSRLGDNQKALDAYRKARDLFQSDGSRLGEGNSWIGMAEVLLLSGKNQEALEAYRRARQLFEIVGHELGQGNSFKGEAEVLFRSGDNQGALDAYKNARSLFEKIASQLEQANTTRGEADVIFFLGDNQGALRAYRKARDMSETIGDNLEQGNALKGEAEVLFRLGDNRGAIDANRKARELFKAAGDQLGQGNTWRGEAAALSLLGDNHGALDAYKNARELYKAVGAQLGQGNTLIGVAEILFKSGDNQNALHAYRSARELFKAVGDRLGQGNALHGEGKVLFRFGDNHGALGAFRSARELFQAVGAQLGHGVTLADEARVLAFLGDDQGALDAYKNARPLFEAVGSQLDQGNAWHGEARVLFKSGNYLRASRGYRQARRFFETAGSPLGQGNTIKSEADLLYEIGDSQGALEAYQKARGLFETAGDPLGQGNTLKGEGKILARTDDYDGALKAYREAQLLFEGIGARLELANTLSLEAEIFSRQGDAAQSIRTYRSARKLHEMVGDQLGEGYTWRGEAEVLLSVGEVAEAAVAAERAAKLAASRDSKLNEVLALISGARAYRRLREPEKSVQLAGQAIDRFDEWRSEFLTDAHRTHQEDTISSAYNLLIPALWHLDRLHEALVHAEESRSRVLLDLVATRHSFSNNQNPVPLRVARQRDELLADLAEIGRELSSEPSLEKRDELERRRIILDAQLERLVFESLLAGGSPLGVGQPLDLESIRLTVDEAGPLLLYYVAGGETFIFLLRKGGEPFAKALSLPSSVLRRRTQQLADALANPNYEHRASKLARELWAGLLGPVAEQLPAGGPLTVVPHGPLHQVAFEALTSPKGEVLFERFDITVTPSISTLQYVRARHREPRVDDTFLAFAAGEGLRLPAGEIQEIATFFDPETATLLAPATARYSAYESHAPQTRHLVIASQGTLTSPNRRQTYLEIEPSDAHDGRLTAAEIATIPLDAELVTLAACDTGAAEALLSDERLDLARAFLIAGAAAVLATRWKVPEDYRTSRFLVDFYRAYRQGGAEGQGMRKDQALTEARRLSRGRGDPAQIWAAWVLVGDAR